MTIWAGYFLWQQDGNIGLVTLHRAFVAKEKPTFEGN
jgi:hypothetical protein